MKKSIYSVPCTNVFGADFSWFHVDAKKSGKEEGKCLCAWGHFNYCVPRTLGECPFVWPINMWTPLAALTVSSLHFSLRCPKRYAQNGARLTSWCIPTANVTVVPVSKSAGDCPVKFVFRDVTAVELLTFLLWVFISILWVIFSSFSLAPHFHLHLFLSASFLFCGDLAPGHHLHSWPEIQEAVPLRALPLQSVQNHPKPHTFPPKNNANGLHSAVAEFSL